jgi:hypothetical protein
MKTETTLNALRSHHNKREPDLMAKINKLEKALESKVPEFANDMLRKDVDGKTLVQMGFTECPDEDGRGATWYIQTTYFKLMVDAWGRVFLFRRNPDHDPVTLHIPNLFDLQCVIDYIKD